MIRFFPASALLLGVVLLAGAAVAAPPRSAPAEFSAWVGGGPDGKILVEWKNGELWYTANFGADHGQITPSDAEWKAFRGALDAIGVWQWSLVYSRPDAGAQTKRTWSLIIRYGDHALKAAGTNAFPGEAAAPGPADTTSAMFEQYLQAVEALLGGDRKFRY